MTGDSLYRLLAWLSPAYPIGAFSYSHGLEMAVEDGSVRDVATLLTLLTGLPVSAVARPLGYLAGMSDYRVNPTSGADMARGLVTGVASPESK